MAPVWRTRPSHWSWVFSSFYLVPGEASIDMPSGCGNSMRRFQNLAGEYVPPRGFRRTPIVIPPAPGKRERPLLFEPRHHGVAQRSRQTALENAMTFARANGYRPYLLIETGEQQEFVDQFAGNIALGRPGRPPGVDINPYMLKIYDPEDFSALPFGEAGSQRNGSGQKKSGHSPVLGFRR